MRWCVGTSAWQNGGGSELQGVGGRSFEELGCMDELELQFGRGLEFMHAWAAGRPDG